jgi:predicted small lipoprotein YifL
MRRFWAAVLLIACVGCGEKGPTAAEKAAVYMAAKSELESLEKQKAELLESHRQAVSMNIQFSEQEKAEYEKACKNIDTMIENAKKVIAENNPTTP